MLLFTIVCTISKHKRHIGAENIAKREEVEEELVPFAFYSIHKEMRIRENSFSLCRPIQTFKQVFFRFHFLNLLQINSL